MYQNLFILHMQLSDIFFSYSTIVEQTLDRDMQVCCSFSYAFEGTYKNNKHKFIWGSDAGYKKTNIKILYITMVFSPF